VISCIQINVAVIPVGVNGMLNQLVVNQHREKNFFVPMTTKQPALKD